MFWYASFLAQMVGVIFVILSADRIFNYRKPERLDGRMTPESNDKRLVWFIFVVGLILVFMPYILAPILNPLH